MKRKLFQMLLLVCITSTCIGCGKGKEVNLNEGIASSESEVQTTSTPKPTRRPQRTPVPTQSPERVDVVTPTEEPTIVPTVEPTIEPSAEPTVQPMYTEEDLVRVEIPEENIGLNNMLYSMADYKVEGEISINENISFGVTLDSPNIKKLITLIYEGTGCTSHIVIEEYYAIFEYEEYDYSAYIELSNGAKYSLYIIGDMCYALESK